MNAASTTPIRWGILGCGDVTEVKSGPGFQKAAGAQLTAVMRRTAALAEDYARRHGVPKWYADADALIQDPDVDAVYIATPPGTHREYTLRVCAAGKPAYVEKPMARNATECDEMVAAFAAAKLPLFVAYYRRAQPRFLKVKEILESGVMGPITSMDYYYYDRRTHMQPGDTVPWRLEAAAAGGGLLLDVGSHVLDLCDFFFGPLTVGQSRATQLPAAPYAVEDYASAGFRTATGVPGKAVWSFWPEAENRVTESFAIQSHTHFLEFSVFGTEPLKFGPLGAQKEIPVAHPAHVAQPLIQEVTNDLLGLGPCSSTGEAAARTSRIIDTVLQGYYGGREDAFWTRPETWPGRRKQARG
jgi:predicted dehydrogenase